LSAGASPRRGSKERDRQAPTGQWDDVVTAAMLPYRLAAEWWRSVAEDANGDVVSRFVQAQTAMAQFLETSRKAWTGGTDASVEAARQRFEEMVVGSDRHGESGDLWRLYQDQVLQVARRWTDLLTVPLGGTALPKSAAQPLEEMTEFWWETFGKALGAPMAGYGLGPGRDLEDKMRGAYEAWLRIMRANSEFQALLAQTWTRVFEEMTRELGAEHEAPITTPRALARLWIAVADRVFSDVFNSDTYIERQARVINAATDYRIKEREIADVALKGSHLASKSELDETSQALHALSKEVRAVRREINALAASSRRRPAAPADEAAGRG
jgi:class III poly(R)-hydroxyalkanoic acid synthase PhaE subunit